MIRPRLLGRGLIGLTAAATAALSPAYASAATLGYSVSSPVQVSNCSGKNAEVEQATDPARGYVYEDWIAADCHNIAFSVSKDGGRTWSSPISVPGSPSSSVNAWDPAVTVGSDGKVYASFMVANNSQWYPVVARSSDFGASFDQEADLTPPAQKNWGDRDFIAVDPKYPNVVYLTWDYGPNRSSVTDVCAANGSCGFATGDVNIVIQKSTDYGKTWSGITHVSPGFPNSGADSGPIFVEPGGRIDVLLQVYPISNPPTDNMAPGYEEFTSSTDGGQTWSTPVTVGPNNGTMSLDEWWIDGALAIDSTGNLYASWDTQAGGKFGLGTPDTGWLSFSTDHGATWSTPLQVTDDAPVPHIMEVTGGARGMVYVSWLTQVPITAGSSTLGYAEFLRPYSIASGWLTQPIQVSGSIYGDANTWPGDTTGLSTLASNQVVLSWGSGVPSNNNQLRAEIFSAVVTFQR